MTKKKPVRRRRGVSIKDRLFALEQWVRFQNSGQLHAQLLLQKLLYDRLCARVTKLEEDQLKKKARRRGR